jgi:hypothetical protein
VIRAPKKAPYSNTEVPFERTQMQINQLLKAVGIEDYQWSTIWSQNKVTLRFVTEKSDGKKVAFEISPSAFISKRKSWSAKKGSYETVEAPNWPQALRLLLNYLQQKFYAVAYGLREVEQEFLSDMVVLDPHTGRETTVGKIVLPAIEGGRINLPQLEDHRERTVHDVDARAVP